MDDFYVQDDSDDFFESLNREYKELERIAKERNQNAIMIHYPAAGEPMRVGNVRVYSDSSILVFYGDDANKNPCVALVPPQNAQLLLKIVTLEEEPERRTIGFTKIDAEDETSDSPRLNRHLS